MKGEIERKLKWFEARAVVDNMINIETHRVAVHQQIMWSDVDKGAHPNLIEGICRRIVLRKPNAVESSWVVGERHLEWRPLPLSTRISGPLSKHLPVTTSRHFLFLLPLHYNQPHLRARQYLVWTPKVSIHKNNYIAFVWKASDVFEIWTKPTRMECLINIL